MFRSMRWTLQLWHAGLLALVLVCFGAASYVGISRARYQQLNADLERSVQMLVTGFRPPMRLDRPPEGGFDGGPPGPQMWESDKLEGPGPLPPPIVVGLPTRPSEWPLHEIWRNPPKLFFEVPDSLAGRFTRGPDDEYYVIWSSDGKVLHTSNSAIQVPYPGTLPEGHPQPPPMGPPQVRQRGKVREAFMNGPFSSRLLVGTSIRRVRTELRHVAFLLAAIGVGVLGVGLVGGWLVSLRAVRPIGAITAVAREISASNLSRRIDVSGTKSELGQLADVLNETFARLEAAFQQQVRFTADASHELRTPLAVVHTHAQLALSRERSAEEYRKMFETCLRASSRMKDLVDSLLLLARADAGRLSLSRGSTDLRSLVAECVQMVAPLAEKKRVVLETSLEPAALDGDSSRLAQVVTNLLTNAIRYNREGGRVHISVATKEGTAVLTVADTGVGIPSESQAHMFERFYRVDKARSREDGGSGLGLAICKSVVEAHGGTINFDSEFGRGTTFRVHLPCKTARVGSDDPPCEPRDADDGGASPPAH